MLCITGFSRLLASCRILPALLLLAGPAYAEEFTTLTTGLNAPAPKLTFKDDRGATHDYPDLRGKLTAIHFWATWCVPCISELAQVNDAQRDYRNAGLRIIAISLDGNNMDKVKKFLNERNYKQLTPYIDKDMSSFKSAGINGLPSTIFINERGQEIARAEGPLDWRSNEMRRFLDGQLN